MEITVDIIKENKLWALQKLPYKKIAKQILKAAIDEVGREKFSKTISLEVAILLTGDGRVAELNNEFRKKNKPTNVLSFPDRELYWRNLGADTFEGEIVLGDIAISYPVVASEADSFNISFENHFTHMLVHAILHLIGYDHQDEEDAQIMQELEIKILSKFDITLPPIYAQKI